MESLETTLSKLTSAERLQEIYEQLKLELRSWPEQKLEKLRQLLPDIVNQLLPQLLQEELLSSTSEEFAKNWEQRLKLLPMTILLVLPQLEGDLVDSENFIEEQEFGHDHTSLKNYDLTSKGEEYTYEEIHGHSDHEQEEYERNLNDSGYGSRSVSRSPSPIRNNQKKSYNIEDSKKTISYKDTMKLIDYIFISNYWDKKIGNATLVDAKQIGKWMKHFKDIKFGMRSSKSNYFYGRRTHKDNLDQLPLLINTCGIIKEILLLGNGKISLCGGSLLELINNDQNGNDWDFFFHCETTEEADDLLSRCLLMLENNRLNGIQENVVHSRNQQVHTVEYGMLTLQFIKRVYKTKDQILLGFDLAPSRIGYNPVDGLFATVCGGLSIAMKCFPLDTTQRSMSFGYRLDKYMGKGFKILYPGLPEILNGNIQTPDGKLSCGTNGISFRCKDGFESDYEGGGNYFNWIYILKEQYHLMSFQGNLDEILELGEYVVRKSIESHVLFEINEKSIKTINVKTYKFFLGDKYREFIDAFVINEDEKRACQIWKDRCDWYVGKGLEIAKSCKENRWKIENPGSQSFGKFNPILEHPKMWYGDNYQSVEVGIKTPRFQELVRCLRDKVPEDIINLICDYWLKAEVDLARNYLFSLGNESSRLSTTKMITCVPSIHRF
jgi:hypothetical protein